MMKTKERTSEKWIIGQPGGINGPFYSVVKPNGNIVALQIPDKATAILIASLPKLLELKYEWASIINSLAIYVIDGEQSSNEQDQAEEWKQMVLPYLGLNSE